MVARSGLRIMLGTTGGTKASCARALSVSEPASEAASPDVQSCHDRSALDRVTLSVPGAMTAPAGTRMNIFENPSKVVGFRCPR